MAEARWEEDGERERRDRDRSQTPDHIDRSKTEHLHYSQGPLSSIRAAIKRSRTHSPADHPRDRRRPEITIVSAEPLAINNWFPGTPVVFTPPPLPPSQSGWSADVQAVSHPPPSYDQVIQEKTQEEHLVKPTAAPRRSTCTATSATQTDPVREDPSSTVPQRVAARQPAEKTSAGKKPPKPLRPSLPKLKKQETTFETVASTEVKVGTNTTASTNTEDRSNSKLHVQQPNPADSTCSRSVTVHWDIPARPLSSPSETPPCSPSSELRQRPIPLPRIKSRKQEVKEEVKVQPLVKISENCDAAPCDSQDVHTNEYLKELLEVFSAENECEENCDVTNQSVKVFQAEDVVGEMNINHSQRNIRARIQAFENQASAEQENAAEPAKPDPLPRKPSVKPPVAAKPSVGLKPQFSNSFDNQNAAPTYEPQNPTPGPRPQAPKKPAGMSIKDELEALHSKVAVQNRSSPPVQQTANDLYESYETPPVPPTLPSRPFKEPLKANLNMNNHNSASLFSDNDFMKTFSDHVPVRPQSSVDSNGGTFPRQSITRRPTTIRVPSKSIDSDLFSVPDNFLEDPPPLPVQKPIGSLISSMNQKQSPTPFTAFQDSFQFGPEPSLPPRRASSTKTVPPRPPLTRPGPGRPHPPSLQAAGRSNSTPWDTSPKSLPQKAQRKGPVLPPRPNPGHRLYNKYILELPHGIACFDYNGSNAGELSFQKNEVLLLLEEIDHNTFECQAGETRGRVHKSHMTVITPLESDVFPPQSASPAASGGDGYGQRVQVIHDFIPEGPGELTLRAGDVVTMVEQVDSEWYRGTCRGSTGFFPINYVKALSDSPKTLPKRKPKPPPATTSGPRCVARFDFEGEHSDELSFSEGDVIQLKEYVGDDWARGNLGASTGIFPLNYVEVIEDLPPPTSQQQKQPSRIPLPGMTAPLNAPPAEASQPSEAWVMALYDYAGKSDDDLSFKQGDYIQLIHHLDTDWSYGRLSGREGMFPRSFVESTTAGQQSSNNQQNQPAGGVKARALYNFTSDCDEELSLQVGNIITNVESIDDEWFVGDLRGKRGLVPKNYVQVLG
ncbi:SH3 domain-containing protein 19 isoform X1 [Channa argus]|uniref:SH3 domain-containing protein 19 isoform X1 n=1 Tax=Channa argus TaxID=215402 RepID=UPI0035210E06